MERAAEHTTSYYLLLCIERPKCSVVLGVTQCKSRTSEGLRRNHHKTTTRQHYSGDPPTPIRLVLVDNTTEEGNQRLEALGKYAQMVQIFLGRVNQWRS